LAYDPRERQAHKKKRLSRTPKKEKCGEPHEVEIVILTYLLPNGREIKVPDDQRRQPMKNSVGIIWIQRTNMSTSPLQKRSNNPSAAAATPRP
jgi:hypothetical protein